MVGGVRTWPSGRLQYTLRGMSASSRFLAASAISIGLVASIALTGCSPDPTAGATESSAVAAQQVSPGRVGVAEFAAVITMPGVQIIDVRTPEEFADGHLAGAVNIPVQASDFADRIRRLDPAGTYAVYCRSGNRSQPAVSEMRDAGITRIYELSSGTKGWTAAGQPLVK